MSFSPAFSYSAFFAWRSRSTWLKSTSKTVCTWAAVFWLTTMMEPVFLKTRTSEPTQR